MRLLAPCVAIAALATTAHAETYSAPVRLPAGSAIELVVEKSREETVSGRPPRKSGATLRYRQTLTPLKDGYRVEQAITGLNDAAPAATGIEDLLSAANLTFEADTDLIATRIVDWPQTLERLLSMIGKTDPSDPQTAAAVRKMFDGMTPELAASVFLKEQAMLSMTQGVMLETGEPRVVPDRVPNPLGGPAIDARLQISLESVDRAAGKAVIRTRHSLDEASATASMRQVLERMLATMPQARKPTPEDLAGLNIARTTDCLYDMDLKTGLTAKVQCSTTIEVNAGPEGTSRRVDRWTITQTLVPK